MLKTIVPLAAALLAAGSIAGIAAQTAPGNSPAEAPRISVADAKKAVDAGKAVLVDVRSPEAFQSEHLKGAINLPSWDIGSRLAELPKDKQIIPYCACHAESTSASTVIQLQHNGYENAAALLGGVQAWKDAGFEVEKKSAP